MSSRQIEAWTECVGRDGWDPPQNVPPNMAVEALNVTLTDGQIGKKRAPAVAVTLTGDTITNGNILALGRFVAAQDETAAELFIAGGSGGPYQLLRVTSGTAAVNLGLPESILTRGQDVSYAMLNGKLFIAYDGAVNRLKVYSPSESTSAVRFVGLAEPAAPTVANTGSGSYAAVQRWYQVQYRVKSGSQILRASNLSPSSTAFTPSGSGTAARVTKPASIGEGETHWAIYASNVSAAGPFYELAEVIVGTTIYDDSADPTTYNTGQLAPLVGSFFPFPSTKAIISDGTRIFGLGVWESSAGASVAPMPGRLYWTPPLGTSEIDSTVGVGDDERIQSTVDQDDWLDLSVNGPGGVDAGLGGPINGVIFAFQTCGVYMIIPTGQATAPFRRLVVSQSYGNVCQQMVVLAEDETGAPCVYFWDPHDGPRRVGLGGTVVWLGKDLFDLLPSINTSATTLAGWGVYDKPNKRVLFGLATGASTAPNLIVAYHVQLGSADQDGNMRQGWAKWTGNLATAMCAVQFANALSSPRPLSLCPYFGYQTNGLARQDGTGTQDFGPTNYQGLVTGGAKIDQVLVARKRISDGFLTGKASASNITMTVIGDWGVQNFAQTAISLAASGSETNTRPRFQGLDTANLIAYQLQVGDSAAANTPQWEIDRIDYMVEIQEGAR
jgi:hypothetical protein